MSAITLTRDMRVMLSSEMSDRVRRGSRIACVRDVPKTMFVDAHERQSDRNHGQTLEGIRGRGGLDAVELLAVFACVDWDAVKGLSEETAHRLLYAMIATHNRGMRIAEASPSPRPDEREIAP